MRRLIITLLLLLLPSVQALADQPFRQHRFDHLCNLPVDSNAILFVGNSITDMHPWAEAFSGLPASCHICNRGVSGATTADILAHIDTLVSGQPYKLFLMIGTNDYSDTTSPQHIARNVARILSRVQQRSPRTQLYLQSILPSTVGHRTIEAIRETNAILCRIADSMSVTYVDLWPCLGSLPSNRHLSFDGLHLTAEGYRLWCKTLAPHIAPSVSCRYPDSTASLQRWGSLWGSNAMRATYCSTLPVVGTDILFFGDEMVKCGEWNELCGLPIRNRGTGWGYDGTAPSIAVTRQLISATLADSQYNPRAIILYTGTGDINDAQARAVAESARTMPSNSLSVSPLDSVEQRYAGLLSLIRSRSPHAPIFILSLMPKTEADTLIAAFNTRLRHLADTLGNCRCIDIHTPLSNPDGSADTAYIRDNYLYHSGYHLVADSLLRAITVTEEVIMKIEKVNGDQVGSDAASEANNDTSASFDYTILLRLQHSRTPQWNHHWVALSNTLPLSALPTAGFFVASRATSDPAARALLGHDAAEAAISFLLTAATTSAVKYLVRRPRPYQQYPADLLCLQPVPTASFPSGHTSFAFSAATTLTIRCPRWYVATPAYLWAASVAFSRLYIGAHYPSDVLAGAILGSGCALAAHCIRLRFAKDNPYAPPSPDLLIPLTLTF